MKIVVDTNIIFSSLVSQNSFLSDALFNKEVDFVMPKYAYIELFKYKEKILQASRHNEDEILELLYKLLKNVDIFDENMITARTLKKAFQYVKDVDEKVLIFVALTIELDGLLWTNDKKLIKGLQKKGFSKICKLQNRELVQINTNDTLK
ncbi:MAG: DNA-binding protein [Candidatus Aminicenantes bacterium]|nr:DNA-binding protein [Candidatus Aminicenantes bacterium]NIM78930.1 DNA-binding protein [Candidatus Aminicenantes bacterium]NIN18190.1 DNA-binding protein [Candidatus Aminicenantes bacterium]NIN42089.1 DNA-binding protein [Candidatus Aminicenantes bacterium]NIN84842.1 DNA-binding protein [Candidatus Aminicenantes bacterium]